MKARDVVAFDLAQLLFRWTVPRTSRGLIKIVPPVASFRYLLNRSRTYFGVCSMKRKEVLYPSRLPIGFYGH